MGEIRLKIDLQQAVANNIKKFNANYNELFFEEDTKQYAQSFYFIDNMNVIVKDNKLNFEIEIDQSKVNLLSKEDMQKVKMCDINSRMNDLIIQKALEENIIVPYEEDIEEEENFIFRKPNELEKSKMKFIKKILEKEFNLKPTLINETSYLCVVAQTKQLYLDRKMTSKLLKLVKEVDVLAILPQFDDYSDDIKGVRLFFGIDLCE